MVFLMAESLSYVYLEDGTVLVGEGFGSDSVKSGELVFTTAMNGYPESLTDPSYAGETMIITHPLVGNYGVPQPKLTNGILSNFESEKVHISALIVSELTRSEKWSSHTNLDDWLTREGVPGISGIDTRMLTKKVRDNGAMMCVVSTKGELKGPKKALGQNYAEINFVEHVSPKRPVTHQGAGRTVVVVDCGVKHGILKSISGLGYNIVRVPYDYTTDKIMSLDPSGVLYSNGPGNPNTLSPVIESMKGIIEYKVPILGICLGHQIACLALGGSVHKMKFGHRAVNKGVVDISTKKACITSHNHGYAVFSDGLPKSGKTWFISPDDNVIEGMVYKKQNMITTQFHPEGKPGTNDASFVFGMFDRMIREKRGAK